MDNQHQSLLKKKEEKTIQQQEKSLSPVKSFTPPPSGIDPSLIVQPKKNILQLMQERPMEERPAYFQPNIIQRLQALPEDDRPESMQPNIIQKIQCRKAEEEQALQMNTERRLTLPEEIQTKMENSFGVDFSNVEIYEGSNASNIGAQAYTQGNEIHFAPEKFNPTSKEGQELIGHEFTHILQQRSGHVTGTTQAKGLPINDDAALEKEADEMGKKAAQGQIIQGKFSEGDEINRDKVQRKEEEEKDPDYNSLAKQLYDAIYGLQTDEKAVHNALKKLNRNAVYIEKLKSVYKSLYQADLLEDIDGDFDFGSYDEVMVYLTPLTIPTEDKPIIKTNQRANNNPERPGPSNNLSILSNVGIKNPDSKKTAGKAYNSPEDVRKVQDQLYSLGYLSFDNYEKEKIDLTKEKSEIPLDRIKETIASIKEFQKIVRQSKSPDGILSITGNDIKYLSTATRLPTITEIEKINKKRDEFKIIKQVSGEDELKDGLTQEVGDTNTGNIPQEVSAIQKRLVELGWLKQNYSDVQYDKKEKTKIINPGESPDKIIEFYKEKYKDKKNSILKEHLTNTIKAIKNFQNGRAYKITYWAEKLDRPNDFTIGRIKPNDVTFHLLKNITHFTIKTGEKETASFSNYTKSGYTVNVDGISYTGKISPNQFNKDDLTKYNLTENATKGLLEASSHEGNFDAINTYDSAIVSFGFIQFAGGFVGNFPILLAQFKEKYPADFKTLYQQYGIDVEYNYTYNKANERNISKAQVTIWDNTQSKLLRGIEAEKHLSRNKELIGILIQSARNTNMQKIQMDFAVEQYVAPSLNSKIGIKINVIKKLKEDKTLDKTFINKQANKYLSENKTEFDQLKTAGRIQEYYIDLTNVKFKEVISSELGIAGIISLYINSPAHTKYMLKTSLKEIIEEDALDTLEKVKKIEDLKVLKRIRKLTDKETFQQRIDKMLRSNLSYEK